MASHVRLNSFSKPRKGFSSCFRTYTTARMSRAPSGIPIEGKSQKKPREPTQQCSLESIWLRSNAFHNVCMNICTMYTIRNCLYLPGKRPYMLHRKRVRAEMIFHISKAKIRAAMRPPLSLHMQLTEDAGLESGGCAALHGTYCVQAPRTT